MEGRINSKESGRIKLPGHFGAVIGRWNLGLRRLRKQTDGHWLNGRTTRWKNTALALSCIITYTGVCRFATNDCEFVPLAYFVLKGD